MARSHYRGTVYGNLTTGAKPLSGAAVRLYHPDTGQPWALPVYPDPVNGVPFAMPIRTDAVGEWEVWAEEPARVRAEVDHPSFYSVGEVIEIRLDPGETATDTDVVESVEDHEAKEDPHDQYLTEGEGNLLYKPLPWEPDLTDYYTRGEADDEFLDQDEADLRYEQLSRKGMPSGYAPLDFAGVIPPVYLPPLAITETWVVISEAEMLALPAQQGDVAVRLDTTENYILRVDPATVLENWTKLAASTTAGNTTVLRREEFTPSPLATTVTLAAPPTTVHAVSRNGVGQSEPAGHYSLSGLVLTFSDPFELGERVAVVYEIGSSVPVEGVYTKAESDQRYVGAQGDVFDVRSYGAVGDGVADDLPAFQAALAAMPDGSVAAKRVIGGTLLVPPGNYYLSDTLTLTKPVHVLGAGPGLDSTSGPVRLDFASAKTGIVVTNLAKNTRIEGVWLSSRSTVAGTDDGIRLRGTATLDRLLIDRFGHDGVNIDTTNVADNANLSRLTRVRCFLNQRHGFYSTGDDSQAMTLDTCDASDNKGWGYYTDGSSHNLWLHCHAAANLLGAVFEDNTDSSQWLHPYVEGGTGDGITLGANSVYGVWLSSHYASNNFTFLGLSRYHWTIHTDQLQLGLKGLRLGGGHATLNSGATDPTSYYTNLSQTARAGDYYFRTDTPGTAAQRLYVCTVAGSPGTWVDATGGGGAGAYLPLTGGALTGPLTVDPYIITPTLYARDPVSGGDLWLDGPAGSNRSVSWASAALPRWSLSANTQAEGGANAGSNLELARFDDAGNYLGMALSIERATGLVAFGGPTRINRPVLGDTFLETWVGAEAYPRVRITGNKVWFGIGSGTPEAGISRVTNNTLGPDGNWAAASTNAYDLGTSALRWRNLFLGTQATIGTANTAAAGAVRLPNAAVVAWRNAGNTADLTLGVDASNVLNFGGSPVQTQATADARYLQTSVAASTYLPLTGGTLTGNLGIKKTPAAWHASFPAVQLGDGAAVWGNNGGAGVWITSNTYYDGSRRALVANQAGIELEIGSGGFTIKTMPGVAAGAVQTQQNRFAVNQDGQVSITANNFGVAPWAGSNRFFHVSGNWTKTDNGNAYGVIMEPTITQTSGATAGASIVGVNITPRVDIYGGQNVSQVMSMALSGPILGNNGAVGQATSLYIYNPGVTGNAPSSTYCIYNGNNGANLHPNGTWANAPSWRDAKTDIRYVEEGEAAVLAAAFTEGWKPVRYRSRPPPAEAPTPKEDGFLDEADCYPTSNPGDYDSFFAILNDLPQNIREIICLDPTGAISTKDMDGFLAALLQHALREITDLKAEVADMRAKHG